MRHEQADRNSVTTSTTTTTTAQQQSCLSSAAMIPEAECPHWAPGQDHIQGKIETIYNFFRCFFLKCVFFDVKLELSFHVNSDNFN